MAKRQITLPPTEELLADADAGQFDDRVDAYRPESLHMMSLPGAVLRELQRYLDGKQALTELDFALAAFD
jgi:hypothetical protein